MRVFLLHGLGRTPVSMTRLARRLRRAGHRTTLCGYLATTQRLETVRDRFVERVAHTLAADLARQAREGNGKNGAAASRTPPRYGVIGHSLGGIVARLAAPSLPDGFERFVMLAPPNRSPAVARRLASNPLFRLLFGDAGQKLASPAFYASLPCPDVPTLVIAGDRGLSAPWLPFRGEPNDGIVRLDETPLPGAPLVIVHGAHTFVMNRRDVTDAVLQFLAAEAVTAPCAGVGAGRAPSSSPGRGC